MDFFYGTQKRKEIAGKVFRNAMFFQRVDPRATRVFIDGDWPKIYHAYVAAGIQVIPVNHNTTGYAVASIPESAYLPTAERPEEQARVEIPADWRRMRWAELRRLAASVSDFPIINMKQATEAIEAELARRQGGV